MPENPIFKACREGDINAVQLYLDNGGDVNYYSGGHSLLIDSAKQERLDIIKLLLDRGANINKGKLFAKAC